jgi:hypothetical protein
MREYASVIAVICPWGALTEAFDALPADTAVLRLADFLLTAGENGVKKALSTLRFDNKTAKAVCTVISLYEEKITANRECICRLLRRVGDVALRRGFELRAAHGMDDAPAIALMERIWAEKFPYTLDMLALCGEDLVTIGVPRGPRIGELLELLYRAIVREEIGNEREQQLSYTKRYI